MSLLEAGRVCVKTHGRNAGQKVVVLELKGGKAIVEGEFVKRRACNVRHLYPTNQKADISKTATHEAIVKTLKGSA